ncbi:MAG: cysteine hydrolase [Clostridia bacterium]|nr:cysteine hydrolase [Clostridia bacterium]
MKKLLIVVDMQNDFITGALGSAEAQAIVERTAAHIRARQAEGYTPIATLDTHGEDYLTTPEGAKLPAAHCIKGTGGWQLNDAVSAALGNCLLVEKPTFGSTRLPGIAAEIIAGDPDVTIELLGVCTDICVVSNALLLKASFPGAAMQVKADCCAGVTPEKHLAALDVMASCQIDII